MRKDRIKQLATEGTGSTILDSRDDGGARESLTTRDAVEKLAYQYWLDRGCPEGSAAEDWLQAERTLLRTVEKPAQPDAGRGLRGRADQAQPSALGAVMRAGS